MEAREGGEGGGSGARKTQDNDIRKGMRVQGVLREGFNFGAGEK